ncbi:MAG: hypothetical protein J6X28_02860 [Bacilli bacterium]|nr:hypothetical protein [Bacilli bacterium]
MKKIASTLLLLGFLFILAGVVFRYKDDVYIFVDQYLSPAKYVTIGEVNEYYRDYDFTFVQNTDNFIPQNRQDILNIYYTMINAGKSEFTFYCTDVYDGCITEIQNIANDQTILSDINNYVHPYNGFSHIETEYDNLGRISIHVMRNYSAEEITEINQRVEELSLELIDFNDSPTNNIKRVHDYIIEHSEYDSARSDHDDTTYESDIAYGPLFQGKGVCGGYTDLMQLFLEKMKIKNFRVSSEKHVWNAVEVDGVWYNLDLTWDDPVYSDGSQALEHNFFLISTARLKEIEKEEHDFNLDHYPELQ